MTKQEVKEVISRKSPVIISDIEQIGVLKYYIELRKSQKVEINRPDHIMRVQILNKMYDHSCNWLLNNHFNVS